MRTHTIMWRDHPIIVSIISIIAWFTLICGLNGQEAITSARNGHRLVRFIEFIHFPCHHCFSTISMLTHTHIKLADIENYICHCVYNIWAYVVGSLIYMLFISMHAVNGYRLDNHTKFSIQNEVWYLEVCPCVYTANHRNIGIQMQLIQDMIAIQFMNVSVEWTAPPNKRNKWDICSTYTHFKGILKRFTKRFITSSRTFWKKEPKQEVWIEYDAAFIY